MSTVLLDKICPLLVDHSSVLLSWVDFGWLRELLDCILAGCLRSHAGGDGLFRLMGQQRCLFDPPRGSGRHYFRAGAAVPYRPAPVPEEAPQAHLYGPYTFHTGCAKWCQISAVNKPLCEEQLTMASNFLRSSSAVVRSSTCCNSPQASVYALLAPSIFCALSSCTAVFAF